MLSIYKKQGIFFIMLVSSFSWGYSTQAFEVLNKVIDNLNRVIINPLLVVLFAGGILLFLSGMLQNLMPEQMLTWYPGGATREKGRQHMLWGMVGLFIMFAVFGIMKFMAATLGSIIP